jgi:hypothetical protein
LEEGRIWEIMEGLVAPSSTLRESTTTTIQMILLIDVPNVMIYN